MPPLATDRESRLRFLHLDPLLPELRREGTMFLPMSVEVLRSGTYQFLDAPFIEKIAFTKLGCPGPNEMLDFASNMSRAQMNFNVDPELPDCALVIPEDGLVMLNMNERCGESVLPGEVVDGWRFEPRCMVLLLAAKDERAAFDEMLQAGRVLSDDFAISVNFTVGIGANPDAELVDTNCAHSRVMQRNYELDTTLHAEYRELAQVREDLATTAELLAFWKHVLASQKLYLPPAPSPPPPPPPAAAGSPPAPPMQARLRAAGPRTTPAARALPAPAGHLRGADPDVRGPDRRARGARGRAGALPAGLPRRLARAGHRLRAARRGGARPVAGGRRLALPRVLDAVDARVRLLRLLVPNPRPNPQPRALNRRARCAGPPTRTPRAPTTSCASSCSRSAPSASAPRTRCSSAPRAPSARSARASSSCGTSRATTASTARRASRASG
jgi:hypothetical protein